MINYNCAHEITILQLELENFENFRDYLEIQDDLSLCFTCLLPCFLMSPKGFIGLAFKTIDIYRTCNLDVFHKFFVNLAFSRIEIHQIVQRIRTPSAQILNPYLYSFDAQNC